MDAVFIALFFFFTVVGFATFYLQRGIGNMAEPMRQFGLFLLNKAPAGIVDLFNDDKGSGSKTWMNLGMIWLTFAAIGTFLALWHDYDATALDSLASIGWEYDDGSALATFVDVTLMTGLISILVGGGLVAAARAGAGRLASEANASLTGLLFSVLTISSMLLPTILGLVIDLTAANEALIQDLFMHALRSFIIIAVMINVLLTVAQRKGDIISASNWFMFMALASFIFGSQFRFFGELADSTQTVWLGERMTQSWALIALIFSVAYHVVPRAASRPIWSDSMTKASLLLLFFTLPPFMLSSADAGTLLENLGAILMTLALLPIMAGSVNIIMTSLGNATGVVSRPGALAATLAMVFFPLYAIGGYFTSLDVFIGLGALNDMATTVDVGFMWTVGGLMAVACVAESYPLAGGRKLASSSSASLSTMLIAFGAVTSTVAKLMGDFTEKALLDSGSEDVVMTDGGFSLTASVLFYFASIGVILLFLNLIRTSIGGMKVDTTVSTTSDISRYSMQRGESSIRKLLQRGVGVDTVLVVGADVEDDGGMTIIEVSSTLHNDEVDEFPVEKNELEMLSDYLAKKDMSIFEFFRSIDLDDSGLIDGYELQQALRSTDIADLPPWDIARLMEFIDLDGDGRVNLPELDIAIARVRSGVVEEE
ncbi:MAG: hypothetical protein CMB70_06460 [Euryarchaeota archaeon]|nr:hypothetical protein [Euryarchaeota archaeon]MBJ14993.1 hypothetical protein [Euryarchaeota archaeon]|tara:strand:- start:7915 stop:9876 length:1962 start_codon:yes stop_codon:yes gene_type:complete